MESTHKLLMYRHKNVKSHDTKNYRNTFPGSNTVLITKGIPNSTPKSHGSIRPQVKVLLTMRQT